MSLRFVLALGAAFASSLPACAQETPKRIERAEWRSLPDANAMAQLYPPRAQKENIGGKATLDCRITAEGKASDCKVVSQTPEDYGFGEAAVALSAGFAFNPEIRDGKPVDGARRLIPVTFAAPPVDPSAPQPFRATALGKAIGEDAFMVVAVRDNTPRNGSDRFACPAGEGPADCEGRFIHWAARPDRDQAQAILAGAGDLTGLTSTRCGIAADGALKDCVTTGEAGPKAAQAIKAAVELLRAPARTDDDLPTAGASMRIRWNWPELVKGIDRNPVAKP